MKRSLRQRIQLRVAERDWLNEVAETHHYMHRPVHPRAHPFGWAVEFDGSLYRPDGKPCGIIMFASVHFTKLRGEFGYPGLPTKWQVLCLSRLWLHDDLPKNSESCTVGKALRQVQRRWLEVHPPRFPDEPYHILKVISFCETARFLGTIYKATNFRYSGHTVGKPRHKGTRGQGVAGEMARYIYDLPVPRWRWQPGDGTPLFGPPAVRGGKRPSHEGYNFPQPEVAQMALELAL